MATHPEGALVQEVQEDGDVVGHQVPDDIDVRPDRPEIGPRERKVFELAQSTGGEELLDRGDRRVVPKNMTDHQDPATRLGQVAEPARLIDVGGHRLFDEDVLAGLERRDNRLIVARRLGGDDHRINLGVRDEVGDFARGANLAVSPPGLA